MKTDTYNAINQMAVAENFYGKSIRELKEEIAKAFGNAYYSSVENRYRLGCRLASLAIALAEKIDAPTWGGGEWIMVESEALRGLRYDKNKLELQIEFKNNVKFSYANVPQDVWLAFISDRSRGRFFHRNIKDRYVATKLA